MRLILFVFLIGWCLSAAAQKELATQAMWEMEKGNLNEAKIKIDLAIKDRRAKKHRRVWYNKGRIYEALYEKNKNEEYADTAVKSYIMSIKFKNNENSDAEERIVNVGELARKDGVKEYKAKDFEKAEKLFNTSLIASKHQGLTDSVNYMNIAMSNVQLGESDRALAYLDTCVQIGYMRMTAAKYTLTVYRNDGKEGMVDKKIAEYRKEYPDNFDLLMLEVNNHLEKGRKKDAINAVNTSMNMYPDSEQLYVVRGDVYLKIKEPSKAEKDYHKAIEMNPKNFEANFRLGDFYYSQSNGGKNVEQVKKAIPYYEQAYAIHSKRDGIDKILKKAYQQAGEYNKIQRMKK